MNVEPSENEMRRLLDEGNSTALELIYDRFGKRIYGYLLSLLFSSEKADEAMQNVFVKIAQNRAKIAKAGNMTQYIFAIARNEAMDVLRSRPPAHCDVSEVENILQPDRPETWTHEELHLVSAALKKIPEEQREVVVMKTTQKMSFAEVSETLGIPQNTAASRYRYGLDKLREEYGRLKSETR